jgi:hypothetical protein
MRLLLKQQRTELSDARRSHRQQKTPRGG